MAINPFLGSGDQGVRLTTAVGSNRCSAASYAAYTSAPNATAAFKDCHE